MNETDIGSATTPDLAGRGDVETLVRAFYGQAFTDNLLGPIFVEVARMDLEAHMPVICDFWETVLFRAGLYHGNAFVVHAQLHARAPLPPELFHRWLTLWCAAVDGHFAGDKAELAKRQGARVAASISHRLQRPHPA
jgi:hemoglobin